MQPTRRKLQLPDAADPHPVPPSLRAFRSPSEKVEYAIEAINNAGTCVGILAKDGIIMAAERKVVSKLLAPSKTSEKTYR